MAYPRLSIGYDKLLDFLVAKATPEEILAFQIPESEKERANELVDRSNAGELTPEEEAELEQMRDTERLLLVLRARARHALKS